MRYANLFSFLAGVFAAALLLATPRPAQAAILQASNAVSAELPGIGPAAAVYSLTRMSIRPAIVHRIVLPVARPATPSHPRLFGYPSANADELPHPSPARPAAAALLFTHAALGVALLDPAQTDAAAILPSEATLHTSAGGFNTAQLVLAIPAKPRESLPSPLPIGLIVLIVLLPAGLVLGQVLIGPSRRPRAALRRRG